MSQPTTHTEPDARRDRKVAPARLGSDWSPRRAWRLRAVWGPVARALDTSASTSSAPIRVLAIGRRADTLDAMLAHSAGARFEVRAHDPSSEPSLPFETGAFDWAVAVDWLPAVRPSQRERAVAELCRVARSGVVIASPFHSAEVAAAERAVNALHVAATGDDHPELGRHVEYGLPDLDTTRGWAKSFPNVATRPAEPLATWQALASVAIAESPDDTATAADAAAAALLPPATDIPGGPAYRTLLVASASPVSLASPVAPADDVAALATHLAIESAAQRTAFDRLADLITTAREREREEFRATVASIAAELHEREAQAEVLTADLRHHAKVVTDQTAMIEAMERRIDETDTHVRNLENEREATRVHVRNLEAERELLRARVRELERDSADTHRHADLVESELEEARRHAGHVEAALRETAETHRRLLDSPGGRALTSYVRVKRKLLRK